MSESLIYLASQSARRRELLTQIGVSYYALDVDIPETRQPDESAADYVERMAQAKARAGWAALDAAPDGALVMGADTSVVLGEDTLGKPRDREHALAMLTALSGRSHRVLSAVTVVDAGATETALSETAVTLRTITPEEAQAYWATGEPVDKAGAYAIQGLGAAFVAHLVGSYSTVVGLPLFETCRLLARFGHSVLLPDAGRQGAGEATG